ncbi:hypothetical protein CHUAL_006288 [Chamberlinius hualienensis]
MYYPWGWPKILKIPQKSPQLIRHVVTNRERVLFACITDDSIGIWYAKPSVLIVNHRRSKDSIDQLGINRFAVWKLDSSALAVVTSVGHILFYDVTLDKVKTRSLLVQVDSKVPSLQRESAELYIKSTIPAITVSLAFQIKVPGGISSIVGLKNELMVATEVGHIERYEWNGRVDLECCLELSRIPFYVDQQDSRGVLLGNDHSSANYVIDLEYSPILGGFAVVLANGRAALLTAPALKFKPSELKGLWAQEVVDAVCTAVNHKYLLIAFGRRNGQTVVCHIDEITGGLQISHQLLLSSKDYPDASSLGAVCGAKWTPDSCALLVTWKSGGMGMWSVYGALLWCSLGWDYQSASVFGGNCIQLKCIEWGAEGYQLWATIEQKKSSTQQLNQLAQLTFLKSSLTVNPCMSNHGHVVLQTDDRLYINSSSSTTSAVWRQRIKSNVYDVSCDDEVEQERLLYSSPNSLLANKQWIVVMIPFAYSNTNWPVRYVAVDRSGKYLAVAGRTGVAHCCLQTKKWKLFGNETQEKDFVVTGGLLWWQDHLILGCYNIHADRDEIRLYPRESKLDNSHVRTVLVSAPVLLLNNHKNRLLAFFADNHIGVFNIIITNGVVDIMKEQSIDVSNLSVHPVCVSHVVLVSRMEEHITSQQSSTSSASTHLSSRRHQVRNILVNVCGRVIMFQLTNNDINSNSRKAADNDSPIYVNPTVLASNVESIWVCDKWSKERRQLVESLLFGCGAQGMKVWLPLFLADSEKTRHFMSKWIMLPINVNVYPLSVLFEDAVIFGVECDTLLMATDPTKNDHFSHPFCVVEKTSQVYLHHILRQLLRRNLGNHAWEIARSCQTLSHFPHALELLLHEVLEDEATSKEPIPDALLPRAVEFIREFPVYLKTVVQCARKIEIALWSHLFAVVDKPQNLFQECLRKRQLSTGASYLLILQNLESSSVSRQYATKLLDASLDQGEWQLCKDLVRFLRAIDPSDVDSPPRNSFVSNPAAKYPMAHPTPPLSPNNDDISFVLGTMQVPRARTYSVPTANAATIKEIGTKTEPKNIPLRRKSGEGMKDGQEFFIDVILKRHARKLLDSCRLLDLGKFAAHLDFHLVSWLRKERGRAAMVHDFVPTLKKIHLDFQWPYPVPPSSLTSFYLQSKDNQSLSLIDSGTHEQLARDSGFLSHSSVMDINKDLNSGGVRTMEAQLRPRTVSGAEDESVRTLDLSEDSSIWGEGEQGLLDEPATLWSNGSGIQFNSEIEQMSAELASKGSRESEIQLRYLLQLMLEANCLEWAVLIAVVLRDAMAVIRIVNAARASDISPDIIQRLKEGLATLEMWADKECLGYKRFMYTIRNQSSALSKITLRMKSPSPSIEGEDLDTNLSSIEDSNRSNYVNDIDDDVDDIDDVNGSELDDDDDEQLDERINELKLRNDDSLENSGSSAEQANHLGESKSSIECSIS